MIYNELTQSKLLNSDVSGWSSPYSLPRTYCGAYIYGGYGYFGYNSYARKTFSGLPTHSSVSISFTAYFLQYWSGNAYYVNLDGSPIWIYTYYIDYTNQSCGYYKYSVSVSLTAIAHSLSSLQLEFTSTLGYTADYQAWGVSDITLHICGPGCSSCSSGTTTGCTACVSGRFLSLPPTGSCEFTCPSGYYGDSSSRKCLRCHQSSFSPYSCATCSAGSSADCLSCNTGSYLYSNGSCIYPCPKGYWGRESPRECVLCYQSSVSPFSCGTCTLGFESNQCTSCDPPYYLHTGQCLDQCPSGYWGNSNATCQKCWTSSVFPYSCMTCSGGGNSECLNCNSNFYLLNGQCYKPCPNGFWGDDSSGACQPCWSDIVGPFFSCATCNGGENDKCLSCNSGTFLHLGQCLSSCPSTRYWADSISNTCQPCWSSSIAPFSCLTCDSPSSSSCFTCDPGYFLYPSPRGQCLQTCPDGYWPNPSTNACDTCWINAVVNTDPYSCETCIGGGYSDQCSSCFAGSFLHPNTGGQCISSCPSGFWQDTYTRTCQPCWSSSSPPYTCATCYGSRDTNCLSCHDGSFLHQGQCINPCPDGYWSDTSVRECKPCWSSTTSPFSCKTCDAKYDSNCLSCNIGTFQYPMGYGRCIDICPDGFYGDNSIWQCKPCYTSTGGSALPGKYTCVTCYGPAATNCKSCQIGTYYSSIENICVTSCPDGYYADNSPYPYNQCRKCYQSSPPSNLDGTCATCYGPDSNQCYTCDSPLFFDATTGRCVSTCPIGYWGNPSSKECEHCYQAPSPTDPSQNCYTCIGPESTNCTSCSAGTFYYTLNNSCLLNCPTIGFWEDSFLNLCQPCYQYTAASPNDNTCVTCTGSDPDNCLSCNSTTYLNLATNRCVKTCPDGYYGENSTNQCTPCYEASNPTTDTLKSCKTCFGPSANNCLSCHNETFSFFGNNSCLTGCPAGFYPNSNLNLCNPCYQNIPPSTWGSCASCTGPQYNDCEGCLDGYNYHVPSKTCVVNCPTGTFANTTTKLCDPCFQATASSSSDQQSCFTCNGPLVNNCLSCYPGIYYYPQGLRCVTTCPIGSYPNTITNVCDSCADSCASCIGPSSTECTSCGSGLFLDISTSSCVGSCPNGTYPDAQTRVCEPCYTAKIGDGQFSCATCNGPLPTQCLTCRTGLALITSTSTCSDTCLCDNGYFYDPDKGICGSCHSSCTYCTGSDRSECHTSPVEDAVCLVGGALVYSSASSSTTSFVAQGGSYSTAVIAFTTNILSGGITLGASTILAVLELLGLYQYLNVNTPSNVLTFFEYVFAGNPIDFPNVFILMGKPDPQLLDEDSIIQGDNKFNEFEESSLFLVNSGGDIALTIVLVCVVPFIVWAHSWLQKKKPNSKLMKFVRGIKQFLMWNFILSNFMSSFVSILFSVCLQLRYPTTTTTSNGFVILSIFLCAVTAAWYFVFMGLVVYVTKKENLATTKPDFFENVRVLVNEEEEAPPSAPTTTQAISTTSAGIIETTTGPAQKESSKSNPNKGRYWALALCLRNFLIVPVIAMLAETPIAQCALCMLINMIFFVVVSKWSFFTSKTKRVIMRISEGTSTLIPLLFLVLAIDDSKSSGQMSESTRGNIGWALIALMGVVMIVSLLYTLSDTWFLLWQLIPLIAKFIRKCCKHISGRKNLKTETTSQNAITLSNTELPVFIPVKKLISSDFNQTVSDIDSSQSPDRKLNPNEVSFSNDDAKAEENSKPADDSAKPKGKYHPENYSANKKKRKLVVTNVSSD